MHSYTPGVHSFTVMTDATRDALQTLWDSDPRHPFIQVDYIRNNNKISTRLEPCRPSVILHGPDLYQPLDLAQAADELDTDILARALLALQGDNWAMEFPSEFELEAGPMHDQHDLVSTLMLPGCIYMYDGDLAELVNNIVDKSALDPFIWWNLGFFAAGKTSSAHEEISAMKSVMACKSAWKIFHDVARKSNASIQITDPAIHPGREGYIT